MNIQRIVVAYPSGNTTGIIFDEFYDFDHRVLNKRVMNSWKTNYSNYPEIEQCCIVRKPNNVEAIARVEMLGGEFCANATRSVIQVITKGEDYSGLIEVSGVDRPLKFRVEDREIAVEMPLPKRDLVTGLIDCKLVQLDGIVQLVVTDKSIRDKFSPHSFLISLRNSSKWQSYGLDKQLAVGVSFYDEKVCRADFCVWVNEVDTIFDETACGSGTCAVAVAVAETFGRSSALEVKQPSGEIICAEAIVDNNRGVVYSEISGEVRILFDGALGLDEFGRRVVVSEGLRLCLE